MAYLIQLVASLFDEIGLWKTTTSNHREFMIERVPDTEFVQKEYNLLYPILVFFRQGIKPCCVFAFYLINSIQSNSINFIYTQ